MIDDYPMSHDYLNTDICESESLQSPESRDKSAYSSKPCSKPRALYCRFKSCQFLSNISFGRFSKQRNRKI